MQLFDLPDNFYPTPPELADRMIQGIDMDKCFSFLEPEAGSGNLVKAISRKASAQTRYIDNYSVDCIEASPYLRQVLAFEFSETNIHGLHAEERSIEDRRVYDHDHGGYQPLSDYDKAQLAEVRRKLQETKISMHIVGDNFLSFRTEKHYDAIIMNPPFENGDLHLIKALQLQQDGGQIVCLLNAETIRNPYTNTRKALLEQLSRYEAKIEYLTGAFATSESERKTDVEVALVRVAIPAKERESFFFESLRKAKEEAEPDYTPTDLTVPGDSVSRLIEQFDFEVAGTTRLIREYYAMRPYIMTAFSTVSDYASPILELQIHGSERAYDSVRINHYLRLVRLKYWNALFHNPEFTGLLTSNLQKEFQEKVSSMQDYDFNEFNIRKVMDEMRARMTKGVEDTIVDLFTKLSEEHSWYPECGKNIHYFNGWKTNKAHMINKKVILPMNGAFSYDWVGKRKKDQFDHYAVFKTLSDIEKALNYLDQGETGDVDLDRVLREAADRYETKNIPCKYFKVTLYKKGTCHITFHCQDIVDKLNIYGCQRKGWLPPSYGKVSYAKMSEEERAVIDDFQGAEAYQKVMADPSRWIVDTSTPLLTASRE